MFKGQASKEIIWPQAVREWMTHLFNVGVRVHVLLRGNVNCYFMSRLGSFSVEIAETQVRQQYNNSTGPIQRLNVVEPSSWSNVYTKKAQVTSGYTTRKHRTTILSHASPSTEDFRTLSEGHSYVSDQVPKFSEDFRLFSSIQFLSARSTLYLLFWIPVGLFLFLLLWSFSHANFLLRLTQSPLSHGGATEGAVRDGSNANCHVTTAGWAKTEKTSSRVEIQSPRLPRQQNDVWMTSSVQSRSSYLPSRTQGPSRSRRLPARLQWSGSTDSGCCGLECRRFTCGRTGAGTRSRGN